MGSVCDTCIHVCMCVKKFSHDVGGGIPMLERSSVMALLLPDARKKIKIKGNSNVLFL